MDNKKKNKGFLFDLQEFEQNLRFKGAIAPKNEATENLNILERLGFTTCIQSTIQQIEQNENIKILSAFSSSNAINNSSMPTKFGYIASDISTPTNLNPATKRMKFINNYLLKILILAIIVNFILIFLL